MADLADHLTVGLLPWLSLDRRVRFAGYTLEPLSVVGPQLEPEIAATLAAIGSTFVQPDGSVDPVLLWPTEEGSLPMFGKPDVETAHAAVRLLAAVGVSSNEYFSWSTPVTATSFTLVFQRCVPGNEFFALALRRREGETLSGGHRFDETRFTQPLSAPVRPMVNLPDRLIATLEACVTGMDTLSLRIRQSSLPFLFANRLDEFSTVEAEVFWVATALEQLLDVANRPPGQGITKTFVARLAAALNSSTTTDAQRCMCETWARELYGQRSEVHGAPHENRRWSPGWHAFLATLAYGLALRTLLAEAGRFELHDDDLEELEAFPLRLGALS